MYHCGYDIFNNHMLRKKGFIHVNQLGDAEDNGKNYNTISDYNRDNRGGIVEQEIGVEIGVEKVKMHLYQHDTIMSMPLAFMDNCIEKDGWWGFTNPNTIEIPNNSGKSISINTAIMSLCCYNTPDKLGLTLIDPKRVEFAKFQNLPIFSLLL